MLKLSRTVKLAALPAFLLAGSLVSAQTLTGSEVMEKYYHMAKPKTSILSMSMVISKNGQSLSRTMTTWGTGDNAKGEVEKKVIKFLAPGDIKGSGFLSLKKVDGSTESQLWLPAMGKVRRLSSGASDQDSAFFGSDFTNRDISGYVQDDFTYELKDFTDNTYAVEATPKKPMGFDKQVYFIDGKDFTSKKIDYYKSGKLWKSEAETFVVVDGYNIISSIVMTSTSGSSTSITVKDQKVDQEFGDLFNERFLKQ